MTHSKAALATCLVLLLSLGVGCRKKAQEPPKSPSPKPTGKAAKPGVTPPKAKLATKPTTQPKVTEPPATKPSTKAGEYLTLDLGKGVTMKLVLIPAGKFMWGGLASWNTDEAFWEWVPIIGPFYMGVYEVTQEQYEAVVGENPAEFRGAKNPVEYVSRDEAVAFCKALSKKTGKTVRLPSQAEWEYAYRAGTETGSCFGDDAEQLGDHDWYDGNSDLETHPGPHRTDPGPHRTHPVGQKEPNAWGLYDIHGNVYEWCSDSYEWVSDLYVYDDMHGNVYEWRGDSWECVSDPYVYYYGNDLQGVASPEEWLSRRDGDWYPELRYGPSVIRMRNSLLRLHYGRNENLGFRVVVEVD